MRAVSCCIIPSTLTKPWSRERAVVFPVWVGGGGMAVMTENWSHAGLLARDSKEQRGGNYASICQVNQQALT